VKRGRFWTKHIGLILGAIGNTLGEHIKTWGRTWEHGRNTSATHEKKTSPPSPLPLNPN